MDTENELGKVEFHMPDICKFHPNLVANFVISKWVGENGLPLFTPDGKEMLITQLHRLILNDLWLDAQYYGYEHYATRLEDIADILYPNKDMSPEQKLKNLEKAVKRVSDLRINIMLIHSGENIILNSRSSSGYYLRNPNECMIALKQV